MDSKAEDVGVCKRAAELIAMYQVGDKMVLHPEQIVVDPENRDGIFVSPAAFLDLGIKILNPRKKILEHLSVPIDKINHELRTINNTKRKLSLVQLCVPFTLLQQKKQS